MKNRVLLAIADGIGDRPCSILGNRTPLEYAKKPNLNSLAQRGSSGIMDLHMAGTPVGTDLGHMILFGYSLDDYPGRGPIEAFGAGVELVSGDIALRANFATCDEDMVITDRRAGRIRQGTSELAAALNGIEIDGVKIIFREATEHRAILVLRGEGLSPEISDTDPKVTGEKVRNCMAKKATDEAEFTSGIVNKFIIEANRILKDHPLNIERIKKGLKPANIILTRGAGQMPSLEKMTEKRGFKGACVAAESTVLGVAKLAGMTPITHPSFTGNTDTDIKRKAIMAKDALKENDFVALHFKATDLMGHDNDPEGKVRAIEMYDRMIGCLLQELENKDFIDSINGDNVIVALASDHSTPCERMEHSGDPVPVVISGSNIRKDKVSEYDEINSAGGALCRMKGSEFINTLFDYIEATRKEGN